MRLEHAQSGRGHLVRHGESVSVRRGEAGALTDSFNRMLELASRKAPGIRGREPARRRRRPRADRATARGTRPFPASFAGWSAGSGRTSECSSCRTSRGWRPGPRWGFTGCRSRAARLRRGQGLAGAVMSTRGVHHRPRRGGGLPDRGAVSQGRERPLDGRLPPPGRRRAAGRGLGRVSHGPSLPPGRGGAPRGDRAPDGPGHRARAGSRLGAAQHPGPRGADRPADGGAPEGRGRPGGGQPPDAGGAKADAGDGAAA